MCSRETVVEGAHTQSHDRTVKALPRQEVDS